MRRHGPGEATQDLESLAVRRFGHQFGDIFHQFMQIEIDGLELDAAGFDLGEVQDVVDDVQQGLAGAVDRLDETLLLVCERGVQQQLGHAEHSVHRRSNLMAHVGQELRFGLARRFGSLLGLRQFRRALGNFLLQAFTMSAQSCVALLDFGQHVVETIDQDADLVAVSLRDTKRIVPLGRHFFGHPRQAQQGPGDSLMDPPRQKIREQQRYQPDHDSGRYVPAQLPVPLSQAVNGFDLADGFLVEPDRRVDEQGVWRKGVAGRRRQCAFSRGLHRLRKRFQRRRPAAGRSDSRFFEQHKRFAIAVNDARRQHVRLDPKRRQGFLGRFLIAERQGCGTVLTDDLAERGDLLHDFVVQQKHVITEDQRNEQQHAHAAGDQLHRGELVPDGQVTERDLHLPPSLALRRMILASFRSCELICSEASRAASRLMANWT